MTARPCPRCGAAVQVGATKCPACRRWIGPRPGRPLDLSTLFGVACGLLAAGAVIGVIGARTAGAPASASATATAPAPVSARASAPATATAPAPVSARASAPAPASGSAPAPASGSAPAPASAPAAVAWSEPRVVRLDVPPIDVALSHDGATLFALGNDGALRVIAADTALEQRKIPLPGRPRRLRLLGDDHLAALDAPGSLPVVGLRTWAVALLDAGGPATDVVALGQGRVILVASSVGRKVARFVAPPEPDPQPGWRAAGEIALQRVPQQLGVIQGEPELAAILLSGDPSAGTIELLDPRVEPFGASRLVFPIAPGPGAALVRSASGPAPRDRLGALDRRGSQLLRMTPAALETSPLGASPRGDVVGAWRLSERYVVVLDGAGEAIVLAESDAALVTRLDLGGPPAGAASTPDGRALLVPLGGGTGGRGAETAVIAGDPPGIAARLRTGAGSRAASVAATGRRAAVAAFVEKSVAILDAR